MLTYYLFRDRMLAEVYIMKENKLVDLSADFAVKIIKLCETIKGHYSLVKMCKYERRRS